MSESTPHQSGYSTVNGLNMYYEVYGTGEPLVLIHGGGSTIQTSFGRIIPLLAENRRIIAVELQAHGRTRDRSTPLSFEQDADDVAALLGTLQITQADFLGFSNGGQMLIALALRHPGLIGKLIIASAFHKRSAVPEAFWEGFEGVTPEHMPQVLKDGFLSVNPDMEAFQNMFRRDVERMKHFQGWTDQELMSITVPTLIINGNQDVGSMEHAVGMTHLFPNGRLAIFPGGHGTYLGTIESISDGKLPHFNALTLIEEFLNDHV